MDGAKPGTLASKIGYGQPVKQSAAPLDSIQEKRTVIGAPKLTKASRLQAEKGKAKRAEMDLVEECDIDKKKPWCSFIPLHRDNLPPNIIRVPTAVVLRRIGRTAASEA
jgi:hypothetical protein